jgi:membrane-bound lytic murein transglycosylase B
LLKRILLISIAVLSLAALLLWKGWVTVTPEGRAAAKAALSEGKSQAKRAAAWALETLFEKR